MKEVLTIILAFVFVFTGISVYSQPTNDGPCEAIDLTVNDDCVYSTFSNAGATPSSVASPSCDVYGYYIGCDMWFTATVPASGLLGISAEFGNWDGFGMSLYSGTDCNNLTEFDCDYGYGDLMMGTSSLDGLAGETIWIRFWPYSCSSGDVDICAFEAEPGLEVDPDIYTPQELVEDVLVTGCLEAFNVELTGSEAAVGYFNGTFADPPIGFAEGMVIGSGDVTITEGPNNSGGATGDIGYLPGDPDIDQMLPGYTSNDATVIEFDFIPSSDTLEFRYQFGSEEYLEYCFSSFNDAFGFFLSGPGISGPYSDNSINIALIPGTSQPVTIDNVNTTYNSAYYINNGTGSDPLNYPNCQLDGITVPLTAQALVTACETYHIKLKVADAGDHILDSFVFFEAGSFSSGGDVAFEHHSSTTNNDYIYETPIVDGEPGCVNYFVFNRIDTLDMSDTVFIDFIISGTADPDNDFVNFPVDFYLEPGVSTDTVYYWAIMDGLPEGTEYIVITIENGCPCSTTMTSDTIWVYDNFPLDPVISPDTMVCSGQTVVINTSINPDHDPSFVTYLWNTGETTSSITVAPDTTTTYSVNIQSLCGVDTTLYMTVEMVPPIDASFTANDSVCISENATITFMGESGPDAVYTWDFDGGTVVSGSGQGPYVVYWDTPGTKVITLFVDDNGCTGESTYTVIVSPIPTTDFITTEILCAGDELTVTYTGTASPSADYTWDFDGATIISGSGQGPYVITWFATGNYTVTLVEVSEDGCISTGATSVNIVVPQVMTLTVDTVAANCYGSHDGQVVVTPSGGTLPYTFLWSTGEGSSTSGEINTLPAGNYTVTIVDANGCKNDTSFIITQPTDITYTYSTDSVDCYNGSDGSAVITASGGIPPYSYQWSNGDNGQDLTGVNAGTYVALITDAHSCTKTATIQISEPTELMINIPVHETICIGQTAHLAVNVTGGTPSYSYNWSTGSSVPVTEVNPHVTSSYSVVVTDHNGCSKSTATTVQVYPELSIELYTNKDSLCPGDPGVIFVNVNGGNGGPYTLTLNNGATVVSPVVVYPPQSGTYTILAEDDCGTPSVTDNITFTVLPLPPVTFSSDIVEGCQPLEVHFSEWNADEGQEYMWNFDDEMGNNYSTDKYPVHIFEMPGTYDISLTVTSEYGCVNSLAYENMITVYPLPDANFLPTPPVVSIIKPLIFFENISTYSHISHWSFGDGDSAIVNSPYHMYDDLGTYTVQLIEETVHGCLDTAEIDVVVKDEYTFYAPTAFSPDLDKINDIFCPVGNGIDPENFYMIIYNRWGEKVYETAIYDIDEATGRPLKGWDGSIRGKGPGECGAYTWHVVYKDMSGAAHERAGTITLIR